LIRRAPVYLSAHPAYIRGNRTRPASVREDMHTGRVLWTHCPADAGL